MSAVVPLPSPPEAHVLRPGPASPEALAALRAGALVARADVGVVELVGPGAVPCAQGLLTNDIEGSGERAFVFGALLTPKGMILVDGWAARHRASVRYTVPAQGRESAIALFLRSVPPRLARTHDHTPDVTVLRLAGPRAMAVARAAGLPVPPDPWRIADGPDDVEVARPGDGAPFVLQVTVPEAAGRAVYDRLVAAGAVPTDAAALELGRILAGWPALGGEIDAKTIPQEVRYDEIGGISYTKGCYTGQETVSRVHFRGHANRHLLGVEFTATPAPGDPLPVTIQGRDVGRVTSVASLAADRWIGLVVLRREVAPGSAVQAGGVEATVIALPFSGELLPST